MSCAAGEVVMAHKVYRELTQSDCPNHISFGGIKGNVLMIGQWIHKADEVTRFLAMKMGT